MNSWRQRIRDLERQIEIRDAIIQKQNEKIDLLEKNVLFLENKLRKYINENTPSSKKPEWEEKKSPDRIMNEKKPIGKPVGSNGGTRETPPIDEEKVVRLYEYEEYLGKPIKFLERIVGDIPPTAKVRWIRFLLAQYKSPSTGDIITATDKDCPQEGSFGPNLRALISIFREKANLSEEQTADILNSLYGIAPAPATIEAELYRTSAILSHIYDGIGARINESPVKYSDETGQSMNGDTFCLYCFSTPDDTYFFSEEKKNSSHIKSRLDDDWNKVLVCDGHSIYGWWHSKQRCWSHATRKEKWLIDNKQTEERMMLHEAISGTFGKCKEILSESCAGPHQLLNVLFLRNKLWQAIRYKWEDAECQKVADYMRNGLDSWFTFMFVNGVEPTNNLDERDIRKHVMKRKISGAFRSKIGLANHCTILSVFETWRKSGKNAYTELVEEIKCDNSQIKWTA